MSFSAKQLQALRRNVDQRCVRRREVNGRELSYLEGWFAISEANRIFGFDAWSRETVETKCVLARENRGAFLAVYTAKVRITVRARDASIVREGHGTGEGRGNSPGEVHDLGLKAAETDATKRALATFGKPFGLALYSPAKQAVPPVNSSKTQSPNKSTDRPEKSDLAASKSGPVPAGDKTPSAEVMALSEIETTVASTWEPTQTRIDKSVLTISEPKRIRSKAHLRFVATHACVVCGRQPSDAHHLRFAQPRALGLKVSDEFTVPLCREHHRQLHHAGNEHAWWHNVDISPLPIARGLWVASQLREHLAASKKA